MKITPREHRFIALNLLRIVAVVIACAGFVGAADGAGSRPSAADFSDGVVLKCGDAEYFTYINPAAVVAGHGTVVVFVEGRKASNSDFASIDLLSMRSADGGRTWSKLQVVWTEGTVDDRVSIGNACPVYDADTGRLWCSFTRKNQEVFVTYSDDDGQSWSRATEITRDVRPINWTRYWTGPGHGLQLKHGAKKGRLVMPSYHTALEVSRDGATTTATMRSHMVYSDDHGKTWRIGQGTELSPEISRKRARFSAPWVPGEAIWHGSECLATELDDGRLYLVIRNDGDDRFEGKKAVAWSSDGGETWSPVKFQSELLDPRCQGSIIRVLNSDGTESGRFLFAEITLDRNGGIYGAKDRQRLAAYTSTDNCATWREVRVIHEAASAYVDLAVLPDGTILCFYDGGERNAYETVRMARFNQQWLVEGERSQPSDSSDTAPGATTSPNSLMRWSQLPALPVGVAGMVGGVIGDRLVVVGGNHFPELPPWKGGKRQFRDEIYLFDEAGKKWAQAKISLPTPLSYPAFGVLSGGLIIAGGEGPAGITARSLRLDLTGKEINIRDIKPLPVPVIFSASATVGRYLFVAGGLETRSSEAMNRCWVGAWDEAANDVSWQEIAPFPGKGRYCATAASDGKSFFVISGMAPRKSADGKVGLERPYLRDAFAYEFADDPARGHWRRLADLPYPVAGSPSPAVYFGQQDRIFVLGGLIGDDENIPLDDYPPFPRHVTAYVIGLDRWTEWPEPLPASCARGDAPVIPWRGGWVMTAGETLPGKRSADVDYLWLSPR